MPFFLIAINQSIRFLAYHLLFHNQIYKLKTMKMKQIFFTVIIALAVVVVTAQVYQKKEENKTKNNSTNVLTLTDNTFKTTIAKGVTLVDFWAIWCGPCRLQGPIVEELANDFKSKAKIAKLDVDKNAMVPNTYGITNIPTIIIFKDGKAVQKFVGVQNKITLTNALNQHLTAKKTN